MSCCPVGINADKLKVRRSGCGIELQVKDWLGWLLMLWCQSVGDWCPEPRLAVDPRRRGHIPTSRLRLHRVRRLYRRSQCVGYGRQSWQRKTVRRMSRPVNSAIIKQARMYSRSGTVAKGLYMHSPDSSRKFLHENDLMAAILKVWHQIKNPNLTMDAYLLEEYSSQISSRSDLNRQSL